jgi:hypothetical protein
MSSRSPGDRATETHASRARSAPRIWHAGASGVYQTWAIMVESVLGEMTIFTVSLPLSRERVELVEA